MNERIRQLADKIWEEKYWTNPNTDRLLPAQLNRFAELIVRKCADLLKKEAESSHDEGTETYNLLLKESKWMKKHFGVGE